ncbi:CopG family ribbon-helix-helix protein [Fervidicoccus fontis]|uniref:Putative nickel-responsive regulator n=2 Tax=Fervidicoccus fontis TaxID=683846 RepID=I0A1T9_FERFK|nr:CopG family ribbon-helix-helix protein [Fervidicoccus fontis]AFH42946.1 putative transcriptional regulator, CopG family [Fervidicoccus fontis Kam940]MBE9391498.1 CopG family ribbon-helix-helix protein [Fervidicoccus fontis]PMB77155.1 MAG: nickel-responsive transcriptional regulator NikR [Fervidicoccus fontis]HEW63641.1 CopG family ribbon-helix-helix protein [Fervidicoccus fontis]
MARLLVVKFGVSFPYELYKELEEVSKELGINSRSKALQNAASEFVARNRWLLSKGSVAGAIIMLYNHETGRLEEKITDIQHEYMDVIVSALHVHVSKEECLLIIAIKGEVSRIKRLYQSLSGLHGVMQIQYSIVPYKK